MPAGWLTVVIVVALCFVAEQLAGRAALAVREARWSLPAGLVAAIFSVNFIWILGLYAPTI